VSFRYDARGRRTSATDQDHNTTTYAYDDADRLVSVTDAARNLTQYGYDTEDNLVSITDGNNHWTYFTYDVYGRVTQTTFPSTLYETYGYDAVGNLITKTDRKSQTIQYVWDALNRLKHKGYPGSTAVDYIYDLAGKIQQVTDPTGVYGFAYDNMGRLIGTTTQYTFLPGFNFPNTYTYDAASNRHTLAGAPSLRVLCARVGERPFHSLADRKFGYGWIADLRLDSLRPDGAGAACAAPAGCTSLGNQRLLEVFTEGGFEGVVLDRDRGGQIGLHNLRDAREPLLLKALRVFLLHPETDRDGFLVLHLRDEGKNLEEALLLLQNR
jgi:YD repeat-containing protein